MGCEPVGHKPLLPWLQAPNSFEGISLWVVEGIGVVGVGVGGDMGGHPLL